MGGQLGGINVTQDVGSTDPVHGHNQIDPQTHFLDQESTVLLEEQVVGEPQALAEEIMGKFLFVRLWFAEVVLPESVAHLVYVGNGIGWQLFLGAPLGEEMVGQIDQEEENRPR